MDNDTYRLAKLGELLQHHQIKIYAADQNFSIDKKKFNKENSYIIPLNQKQGNLIKSIFDRQTKFEDSLFYDISAWNFDLAFNAIIEWVDDLDKIKVKTHEIEEVKLPVGFVPNDEAVAYILEWDQYPAPGFLYALLEKGLIVKVANEPFVTSKGKHFDRGSIVVSIGIQPVDEKSLFVMLKKFALKYHVKLHSAKTGLTPIGVDLGSDSFSVLQMPSIAMLVDRSVSGYEAGEVWHLLDQRFDIKQTMISTFDVDRISLDRYNVLLLPAGSYSNVSAAGQEKIRNWVKNGGTVIGWRSGASFISKLKLSTLKAKKTVRIDSMKYSYAERKKAKGAQVIGGAIFEIEMDITHPLAYGYSSNTLPVFKKGDLAFQAAKGLVYSPFHYTNSPLLSGYVSDENLERIKNSPAVSVASYGAGKKIAFADNPNFRAFWFGTNKLLMNAIFFGDKISTR